MDREKSKSKENNKNIETDEAVTFTKIKSPSRNLVGEANEFLIQKEKEGINISSRMRNQFIVTYTKKENLDEAWRELNGD